MRAVVARRLRREAGSNKKLYKALKRAYKRRG